MFLPKICTIYIEVLEVTAQTIALKGAKVQDCHIGFDPFAVHRWHFAPAGLWRYALARQSSFDSAGTSVSKQNDFLFIP